MTDMPSIPIPLSAQIRAARAALGISQAALGARLGYTDHALISRWEAGTHLPTWAALQALSDATGRTFEVRVAPCKKVTVSH